MQRGNQADGDVEILFPWQGAVIQVGPIDPAIPGHKFVVIFEPAGIEFGGHPGLEALPALHCAGVVRQRRLLDVEGFGIRFVDDDDSEGTDRSVGIPLGWSKLEVDLSGVIIIVIMIMLDELGHVRSGRI